MGLGPAKKQIVAGSPHGRQGAAGNDGRSEESDAKENK